MGRVSRQGRQRDLGDASSTHCQSARQNTRCDDVALTARQPTKASENKPSVSLSDWNANPTTNETTWHALNKPVNVTVKGSLQEHAAHRCSPEYVPRALLDEVLADKVLEPVRSIVSATTSRGSMNLTAARPHDFSL